MQKFCWNFDDKCPPTVPINIPRDIQLIMRFDKAQTLSFEKRKHLHKKMQKPRFHFKNCCKSIFYPLISKSTNLALIWPKGLFEIKVL